MVIPLIVACALFMEDLDATVINTSLPAIANSLKTSPVNAGLAITVYMFSLGLFIPVSGSVADRFGAQRVFGLAIGLFTIGSVLCAFSDTLAFLAFSRTLQGLGGAMMVPVGRLVLLKSVDKTELVRAIVYLTVPALLGAAIGPVIGGFLRTYFSWRWIFFLNVPIGLAGILLVAMFVPNFQKTERRHFDGVGFVLTGTALISLIFAAEVAARPEYSWRVPAALLACGCVACLAYIRHARRKCDSVVDLKLLKVATFGSCIWGGSLFRISSAAIPFLVPLLLQVGFGMSALAAGLLTCAGAIGSLAMKVTTGPILRRWGFRTTLMVNGIVSAAMTIACAWVRPDTSAAAIFLILLAGGFFRSLQYTCLNTLAYADIPSGRISSATSIASMFQQVSNGLGVAVSAVVLHTAGFFIFGSTDSMTIGTLQMAFYVIGVVSLSSLAFFANLSSGAGRTVIVSHRNDRRGK